MVPQIVEALPIAIDMGLRLPIVYNTSAYDSVESLGVMGRPGRRLHAGLQVVDVTAEPTIPGGRPTIRRSRGRRCRRCIGRWVTSGLMRMALRYGASWFVTW